MDLKLRGKTAFITGSASGIGYNTAKVLLNEGVSVFINGKNEDEVSKAVHVLKNEVTNGVIEGIVIDFSKKEECKSAIAKLPDIDILINNVGIYSSQSFFETTDEEWYRQFEVNVMSGVRLSKYLLPKMLAKNWGRIIFISSECASIVPTDLIAYSTTKAAILAVSRGLAQLTKGSDVTVNAVLPGSTLTEGAEKFLNNIAKKENKSIAQVESMFFKDTRASSILQRFASVEEISNTIAYYVSPLSSATNGSAIKIDGGSVGGIL